MRTDPETLIREMRPDEALYDPDSPAARASLERILAEPPATTRTRRYGRTPRRLALAGAATLVAGAAVTAAPFLRDAPDVVARAAEALQPPDTILHFTAQVRAREGAAERRAGRPDDHVDSVVESWQGEDRARSVADGGRQEIVLDTHTGRGRAYQRDFDAMFPIARGNTLASGAPPAQPLGLGAAQLPSGVVGDLAQLLDRARAGDANLHLVGSTTVRGIDVYELQLDFSIPVYDAPPEPGDKTPATHEMQMSRLIYVDREHYLPVRVIERGPQDEVYTVTDYTHVERLPVNAQTQRDLRMQPHPGATTPEAGKITIRAGKVEARSSR